MAEKKRESFFEKWLPKPKPKDGSRTSTRIAAKPIPAPAEYQGIDPEMAKTIQQETKRKGAQRRIAGK